MRADRTRRRTDRAHQDSDDRHRGRQPVRRPGPRRRRYARHVRRRSAQIRQAVRRARRGRPASGRSLLPRRSQRRLSRTRKLLSLSAGGHLVLTGPHAILALKIAVIAVSVLLALSFIPLVRGNYRLHGRINLALMALTLTTVLGLESLVRVHDPPL